MKKSTKNFNISSLILLVIFINILGCSGKDNDIDDEINPPPIDSIIAQVYLTRGDQGKLFSKEGNLMIRTNSSTNWPVITIDTAVTFQTIEGYGAALTGSSSYLLNQKMNASSRDALLKDLFDPETGIGLSYLRLTMGASDFSLNNFSYDDIPAGSTDYNLEKFSLNQDTVDVIPMAKEVIKIFPEITFMGSPWSPPAWMKTNGSMIGGKLKPEAYSVYADYFVRYIQAMSTHGIRIDAITPQNEPLHSTATYPCMDMQPNEQLEFIKSHLGPKFKTANLSSKIIIYDHNWDRPDYPITILNDAEAKQYIAGSAFHAYGGEVTAMSLVHDRHPDKGLYFTEISGGRWAPNFSDNLMWNMKNILIGTARNWSKNALFWNLALDENDGPKNNGCGDCRGVVIINSSSGQVTKNVEYYSLAHFSKFVRPGAIRISTAVPRTLPEINAVAFYNTDGSKVIIALNEGSTEKVFSVKQGNNNFSYTLPAKSVTTIVW